MKITSKGLHIPPYISTSWDQVRSLHVSNSTLVIHLADGPAVQIPQLSSEVLEKIFELHAAYVEEQGSSDFGKRREEVSLPAREFMQQAIPFKLGFGVEELNVFPQHNGSQAHMPDLPPEILEKIIAITKIVAPEGALAFAKAEPHCNCMNCQVSRALDEELKAKQPDVVKTGEEEVLETDLSFQQWEIKETGNQIYSVANKLDLNERYTVYLGDPVGCTCGKLGCDHVVAVLKS